jgi:preprotein translocase subunit Sec61beta
MRQSVLQPRSLAIKRNPKVVVAAAAVVVVVVIC